MCATPCDVCDTLNQLNVLLEVTGAVKSHSLFRDMKIFAGALLLPAIAPFHRAMP